MQCGGMGAAFGLQGLGLSLNTAVCVLSHWPTSWETCLQVRKQQLELDMEQQTGAK